MKVLFSSYKNPHFETFAEYIEKAFKENDCQTLFFENRNFSIPGRIRDRVAYLHQWDLRRLNKQLLATARIYKPDLFLEAGGLNILSDSIDAIRQMGITTALWTIDPPRIFEPIIEAAPHYDFVFTQGSEAYEILENYPISKLYWLPFACDPDFHRPVELTEEEKQKYSYDVCFVGSGWESLYPFRRQLLEHLMDYNLGIWGPGWEKLPPKSPLRRFIKGGEIEPEEWVKVFSATRIVFHSHYKDPTGQIPCYQAAPRVYEALACGVLLVVDKQRDVLRLFTPGEDLAVFDNEDELKMVVTYYLQHPTEAKTIAERGRKKVLENHTYSHRILEILAKITGS